jgi:hypothetical protein
MLKPKTEAKDYSLIIGIRRLKSGAFSGLFEVVELSHRGEVVRVITDANSRSMAAGLAAGAIAKCR